MSMKEREQAAWMRLLWMSVCGALDHQWVVRLELDMMMQEITNDH